MASNTMEIKVKVEFTNADRILLMGLLSHLKVAGTPFSAAEAVTPAPEAEPVNDVNENVETVNENVDTPAEVKQFSIDDVRDRVKVLCQRDQATKEAVKEMLSHYALSVPALKPEDYAAFMAELEALK